MRNTCTRSRNAQHSTNPLRRARIVRLVVRTWGGCDPLLPLLARSPAILEHLLARHTPVALRPRTHTSFTTPHSHTPYGGRWGLPPRASARTYTTRRRSHAAASSARLAGGFGGVLICTQLAARAPHAPASWSARALHTPLGAAAPAEAPNAPFRHGETGSRTG